MTKGSVGPGTDLSGQVALVTGGSTGLGRAIALGLAVRRMHDGGGRQPAPAGARPRGRRAVGVSGWVHVGWVRRRQGGWTPPLGAGRGVGRKQSDCLRLRDGAQGARWIDNAK